MTYSNIIISILKTLKWVFEKALFPVVFAVVAVGCTALANTVIGKVILVGIAAWIAVNFVGLEVTDVQALTAHVKENPAVIAELALDWVL